ncbi:MAG: alanine racemase [Flavobacteriaceae bacterium]|nr:alanine racemase [Flavobacteriaceae bacterium]
MITKPTLILDQQKCRANIRKMVLKAEMHGLKLRPHFKTHQSLAVGRWFKEEGIQGITVSSLGMAQYFSEEWSDITVAFPVNIREINTINTLAKRINLNLLVESLESIRFLDKHLTGNISVFIKLNLGNDRTGLDPKNLDLIEKLTETIDASSKLKFSGFLGHAGQTYKCRSEKEIKEVHSLAKAALVDVTEALRSRFPDIISSYGDTPSCSVCDDFEGVDEIRPGNFVFYDLMQVQIGACESNDIAVALACPVVSIHHDRKEVVIYGGGIHLSKDRLTENGADLFGKLAEPIGSGWGDLIPGCHIKSLSQEHGVVSVSTKMLKDLKVGELVYVLPVHSCMTANLMKAYLTDGGDIITMFNP